MDCAVRSRSMRCWDSISGKGESECSKMIGFNFSPMNTSIITFSFSFSSIYTQTSQEPWQSCSELVCLTTQGSLVLLQSQRCPFEYIFYRYYPQQSMRAMVNRAWHFPFSFLNIPSLAQRVCIASVVPYRASAQYRGTCGHCFPSSKTKCLGRAKPPKAPLHSSTPQSLQTQSIYNIDNKMSLQSDEQTLGRESYCSIEELLNENRIKDLALSKATNLIELLSVELEAERTSKIDAIRQLQEDLRYQFSKELEGMKQKVQLLQRELKRCNSISTANIMTARQASLSRSESALSITGKKRRSNNKKYTEINSEEASHVARTEREVRLKSVFVEEHLLDFAEWKEEVMDSLNCIVANDYEELRELVVRIEGRYVQVEDVFEETANSRVLEVLDQLRIENGQLKSIISQQQRMMNEMKVQMQQLEDVYKHALHKLASNSRIAEQKMSYIDLPNLVFSVRLALSEGKNRWAKKIATLEDENAELKNILDSIINLVQDGRRLRY